MSLVAQTVLQNRYRIVTLLGQGGMGAVYRAWDLRLEGPVAVKEFVPQPGLDAGALVQLRDQFKQEAVILSRLSHPNLVRVRDFFEEHGNAYLVMDLVEGESLEARILRQQNIPEQEALVWLAQLLDALAYCHSQGVLHRDIKPQNVIIDQQGQAILVDFGLVKLWNPNDPQTRIVLRGMGTPEYAPPEQYGKQGQSTDPRSDLYSLGATFYHALTGQAPPTASDRMADPHLFHPVRALNPRVSIATEMVILRAVEPAREARYFSAAEMRAALSRGAPAAKVPAFYRSTARPSALPWWALAGGLLVLLILLGWGGNALLGALKAAPAPIAAWTPTATFSLPVNSTPTQWFPPTFTVTPTPALTDTPFPTVSLPSFGDIWTRPADGMVQVYVPAGEFQMGSTTYDDEEPVHTVALDGFWLDRTEVTNAQYQKCVAAGDCEVSRCASDSNYNGATQPVVCVSWHDAVAYCEWAGGRLPTEAEWEYAARGPEALTYPWGNTWDCARGNFNADCGFDSYDYTAPVGSFPEGASWVGARDLSGNVWEWVADWYGSYPSGRQVNPAGPQSGSYRVLRGGSWGNNENHVRGANRLGSAPSNTFDNYGFRCGVSAAPGE
jgi:formylglycine-generating enzyme required for sulfatase activity